MTDHEAHPTEPTAFRLGTAFRPFAAQRDFRDAMASFATTACVVTARHGDRRLGRTVTSLFSLSVDPPSILVSIDITSDLADMIGKSYGFSLAMLSRKQQNVADAFAGSGHPDQRFDHGYWSEWPSGHPRLAEAVVAMDCDLVGAMETETHMLFAGGVVAIETNFERQPLIWHQRRYKSITEPSDATAVMSSLTAR
ncbi:MAG: flavin reductase [Ahrensia sp.]|nr:flavin reductase [Ahrensia sp.]|tara:strand:+ start:271 stop:858 length:588 start_codon:yes stop_codon:yes gene_type:complete